MSRVAAAVSDCRAYGAHHFEPCFPPAHAGGYRNAAATRLPYLEFLIFDRNRLAAPLLRRRHWRHSEKFRGMMPVNSANGRRVSQAGQMRDSIGVATITRIGLTFPSWQI